MNSRQSFQMIGTAAVLAILSSSALAADQTTVAPETMTKAVVITADAGRQSLISILDRKLALIEDGRVVKVFQVAVGAEVSPSPTGAFKIVNRVTQPAYYHKGEVIAAGAQSPVGTRWMGLSVKGYGIHGTNQPKSIGKAASHGCIRMGKKDLEELFELVRAGDAVVIRGERDSQAAQIFGGVAGSATEAMADAKPAQARAGQ